MTLIDGLKKIGYFLIARKYAPLRTMIILFVIFSSIAIYLTLGLVHQRSIDKKTMTIPAQLVIEDFGIEEKGKFTDGNMTGIYFVFVVKTSLPSQVMLITDNVIGKEIRTVNSDQYSESTYINETFIGEEIYAQFLVSGTVTGEDGTQLKLEPLFISPSTDTPKIKAPKVIID